MKILTSQLNFQNKEEIISQLSEESKRCVVTKEKDTLAIKIDGTNINFTNEEINELFTITRREDFIADISKEEINLYTYIPLHVKSHFSIGKSLLDLNEIVNFNYPAIALVDDSFYGYWDFAKLCRDKSIIPILGYEINVRIVEKTGIYPLTLLAKNYTGYCNICALKKMNKKYYSKEQLVTYKEGIIVLSGGIKSEFYSLYEKKSSNLKSYLEFFHKTFKDDFYVEVNKNMEVDTFDMCKHLKRSGINYIATDEAAYKKNTNINLGTFDIYKKVTKADLKELKYDLHFHTLEEMEEIYGEYSLLLLNTLEIYDKCKDFNFIETPLLFDIEIYNSIKEIAYKNGEELIECVDTDSWKNKLDEEFYMLEKLEFQPFINMIYDLVNYCRENKILYQIRGSAFSSLVLYLLGITQLNPLKYGLLTERFINNKRSKKMDIDFDIQQDKKDLLLSYLINKYDDWDFLRLSKIISFKSDTLVKQIEKLTKIKLKDSTTIAKNYIKAKDRIVGKPKAYASHGSGIAIVDKNNKLPLIVTNSKKAKEENEESIDKVIEVTSYTADYFKFLKLDLLSSIYLKTISKTLNEINLDIEKIPYKIAPFEILVRGITTGIFQLNQINDTKFVKRAFNDLVDNKGPKKDITFDDFFKRLAIVISLNRPGTIKYQTLFVDYIENNYTYTGPFKTLEETKGILIYQEQLMLILNELTNLELPDCDVYRKLLTNSNLTEYEFNSLKSEILEMAERKGNKEKADIFFKDYFTFDMKDFFFNKSHAISYAVITYITLYLIREHRNTYYKNLLENTSEGEVSLIINRLRAIGVEIVQPEIESCGLNFYIKDDKIHMGLNNLQNVCIAEKPEYVDDLEEYIIKNDIDDDTFKALASIGYFDIYGFTPEELINELDINLLESNPNQPGKLNPKLAHLEPKEVIGKEDINQLKRLTLRYDEIDSSSLNGFIMPFDLINDISNYDRQIVETVGKVTSIEKKLQRNGETMLRFFVTYEGSKLKCVLFSSRIGFAEGIVNGSLVMLRGEMQDNAFGPTLNVTYMKDLKKLSCNMKKIEFTKKLDIIMEVLSKYKEEIDDENNISIVVDGEEITRIKYSYLLELELARFESMMKIS